jgi:hypothetical protein
VSVQCPHGHDSGATDYCDQCGTPIGLDLPTGDAEDRVQPPTHAAEACRACGAVRSGADRFCEVCGYDYVTGAGGAAAPGPADAGCRWQVVVTADRHYYETLSTDGITFPDAYAPRTFPLEADEVRIGRRSGTRGVALDIDLAGDPEDTGVSHVHVLLARHPDGTFAVLDLGSTNGTTLNDDEEPIPPNSPVALVEGDRLHLGAWTTITLARLPGEPDRDA